MRVAFRALRSLSRAPAVARRDFRWMSSQAPTSQAPPGLDRPLTETVRDFLSPAEFYGLLKENAMDFYTGVPDSLLKDFCAYVTDNTPKSNHVITANEGAAVSLAAGYHLATRKIPVVYMQNSGFGNAVNPILSLCAPQVYSVPMLMLVGWRGEPGKKDEPQHLVQGKVMSSLLTDMNIQYEVLPDYIEGARETIASARHYLESRKAPYVLLVKRQTFTPYKLASIEPNIYHVSREKAIELMVAQTGPWDIMVVTTGFASREIYEFRQRHNQGHMRDFLTVGSMGHASAISMGIAMNKPSRQVICLDGDGAMLMHMGTTATIGLMGTPNLKHVVLNNGCHDSVGGQPTRGFDVDFCTVAKACGYKHAFSVSTPEEIVSGMQRLRELEGPVLMEVRVNKGARKDLGRPKTSPKQNKEDFMKFLDG